MECAIRFIRMMRAVVRKEIKHTDIAYIDTLRELSFEVEIYKGKPEFLQYVNALQWQMRIYSDQEESDPDFREELNFLINEYLEENIKPNSEKEASTNVKKSALYHLLNIYDTKGRPVNSAELVQLEKLTSIGSLSKKRNALIGKPPAKYTLLRLI